MRALVSVSDKSGLDRLASFLIDQKIEIVSSGGTRKYLEGLGLPGLKVTPIEEVTGNPEAFGGRMKTLSFEVSSGILFRRGHEEDLKQAKELAIKPIDIVVCNLYPFARVKERGGNWDELIENIDIGGPTLIRAAAKNYYDVWTLTAPEQYDMLIENFESKKAPQARLDLAKQAFAHTASYDQLIAETFDQDQKMAITIPMNETRAVRYGENPHQKGFVWGTSSLASALPIHGKELSFNNYLDADAAWRCLSDLHEFCQNSSHGYDYATVVIKHSNPCGAAIGQSARQTLEDAWNGDNVSAFGSIIAFNHEVDGDSAHFLNERFVEVVLAPNFSDEALAILKQKKNIRLINLEIASIRDQDYMVRTICGGFVIQEEDPYFLCDFEAINSGCNDEQKALMHFGILVNKHLKSNAICLVKKLGNGLSLIGAGMGNPNRLISIEQSVQKAHANDHLDLSSSVLISDAFFPFRDNIDLANKYGIKSIVQPGGSIKDQDVIDACGEHGIAMFLTKRRHFRH